MKGTRPSRNSRYWMIQPPSVTEISWPVHVSKIRLRPHPPQPEQRLLVGLRQQRILILASRT